MKRNFYSLVERTKCICYEGEVGYSVVNRIIFGETDSLHFSLELFAGVAAVLAVKATPPDDVEGEKYSEDQSIQGHDGHRPQHDTGECQHWVSHMRVQPLQLLALSFQRI